MSTLPVQFSDIYNPMPSYPEIEIALENKTSSLTELVQLNKLDTVSLKITPEEPTFKPLCLSYTKDSLDNLEFTFYDDASQFNLVIQLSIDTSKFEIQTIEPTIKAGILSSRLLYLLSTAKTISLNLTDSKNISIKPKPLSKDEYLALLYRAKLYRKLGFIEKVLQKESPLTIKLPKEISANDIAFIDTIYRGITRGNVFTKARKISLRKEPPFDTNISKVKDMKRGPISFDVLGMELFDLKLSLGKVKGIVPNALLLNAKEIEKAIKNESKQIIFNFEPTDDRIIFHFADYIYKLDVQKELLEQYVAELKKEEPVKLANLVYQPLLGDISSIESGEIVLGWIYSHFPDTSWPAISVQRTELDKEGKYWQVSIKLQRESTSVARIVSNFSIDRKTGDIAKHPSYESIRKHLWDLTYSPIA